MTQISTRISSDMQTLIRCGNAVKNMKVNVYGINSTLQRISQEIEVESQIMHQMSAILSDGTRTYCRYEENLAKMTGEPVSSLPAEGESTDSVNEVDQDIDGSIWDSILQIIVKFVGNAGAVGGVVSAVATWLSGDGSPKDYISIAKYLSKAAGNGAVAFSKGGIEGAKYMVGWSNALKDIDTSSFGKAFKSSLVKQKNQLDFSKANSGTETFNTATKWAGHILTVAGNGYENYIEYKEDGISAERAVGETVIESAVDIAVGIGATALVTAACATIGFTAPVVVVGIGATAITMSANAICKWATGGKDLGEAAADGLYWLDEKITDIKENVKSGIKNTIRASWRGICEVFA